MKVRRALFSVSDREGIVELARGLEALGAEILCTGGTERHLRENGLKNLIKISNYTKQEEILDGRVKTLHPFIFGGILADRDMPSHAADLKTTGAEPIDMVVVNLYPFESLLEKEKVEAGEAIELIDIGGPSLIRAAAKNQKHVAVLVSPSQYGLVLSELKSGGGSLSKERLAGLAVDAFAYTSAYDSMIYNYFAQKGEMPDGLRLSFDRSQALRYGENPYQKAAFYSDRHYRGACIHNSVKLQGKELSFNNILDLDSAMNIVRDFDRPTAAVIKHTVPCGLASADTPGLAYELAYKGDTVSAYGGIVSFNRDVDAAAAEAMRKHFIDCIIAPGYTPDAMAILKRKEKTRVMMVKGAVETATPGMHLINVKGGMLAQTTNFPKLDVGALKQASKRSPTKDELGAMAFGWKVVKHVKSNGIVLAKGERTVGVGGGQTSRVDAVRIACWKAKAEAKGSVLASDAFFPFRDGLDEAAKAGVTAVIQSGGSIRDEDVIKAANEHGMAMMFTGFRQFRH